LVRLFEVKNLSWYYASMSTNSSSRQGRKPRFDEARRQVYLDALSQTGVIGEAMRIAGVKSRTTLKNARETVSGFEAAEMEALEMAADKIESLVHSRAILGHRVPVVDENGSVIVDPKTGAAETTFIPPNDKFLMARLKALKPQRYGTARHEVQTRGTGVLLIPQAESNDVFEDMLKRLKAEASAEEDAFKSGDW